MTRESELRARAGRFASFGALECYVIADALEVLDPDATEKGDEARAVKDALEQEARHAAQMHQEADIEAKRVEEYRRGLEREAAELLAANGFTPELAGGGCYNQARHWPNGAYIWATNESGCGTDPTATHFCVCVYGVDADNMTTEPLIDLRGADENGGRAELFLVDAVRQAIAAATAVDALLALHNAGAGPCTEADQREAAENAAAAVQERDELVPDGFKQWAEVCQGATIRQVNERGGVHICDLTGQEGGTAESWAVSVFVGLWDFGGEMDWPHPPVELIHTIRKAPNVSFDMALAGALAMADAL